MSDPLFEPTMTRTSAGPAPWNPRSYIWYALLAGTWATAAHLLRNELRLPGMLSRASLALVGAVTAVSIAAPFVVDGTTELRAISRITALILALAMQRRHEGRLSGRMLGGSSFARFTDGLALVIGLAILQSMYYAIVIL